nr:hypothetical protein [Tanacetum cinerariifolium]
MILSGNHDPISNYETPNFSYPPSQPQTSSFDQFHCFGCGDPLEEGIRCQRCTCKWCGYGLREGFCLFCTSRDENSSIDVPNPNSFNDPLNIFTHSPQHQYESYSCELCGNDSYYVYDCPPWFSLVYEQELTPVLPIEDPEDSLIMRDEDLYTIPKNEVNEFIKSSVEDLVPISIESEDTSNSECDFPFFDNSLTFSNPLFDLNDDFTSSDDESLSDEDAPKDNVKIYSNPLFKFDDEYISSDVNPLFDEVLEDIENKDSYNSNLDESDLLVTPLSEANEDECFDPGDDVNEIELLLHRDPSTPKMSIAFILEGFTNEPPLEENDDLFDLESKVNEWKKILYDAPTVDLMTEDKVFDLGIHEKKISPTYVRLPFEDRHYLFLTYVI